ncbi:uncharacterized protein BO95DRAFT_460680 [Aspergillus brunneoviolaceus CBS 621.78]|uniref:Uncharacterized protein n=1 Tax=Aspergillus brunneoviolaceus CBS 621.78 TaxID=1450534 RepID=A0ACD1GHL4_9EURO|nr:hypothetical protein BO95DRAFT_460680 [Aspergillus brunneoviolaceus CBS 621.78]RAH48825.1 hypothetical protein BO95DRAFT_460680 [Aspergillus brunneoviolaceus CBS 621.78]
MAPQEINDKPQRKREIPSPQYSPYGDGRPQSPEERTAILACRFGNEMSIRRKNLDPEYGDSTLPTFTSMGFQTHAEVRSVRGLYQAYDIFVNSRHLHVKLIMSNAIARENEQNLLQSELLIILAVMHSRLRVETMLEHVVMPSIKDCPIEGSVCLTTCCSSSAKCMPPDKLCAKTVSRIFRPVGVVGGGDVDEVSAAAAAAGAHDRSEEGHGVFARQEGDFSSLIRPGDAVCGLYILVPSSTRAPKWPYTTDERPFKFWGDTVDNVPTPYTRIKMTSVFLSAFGFRRLCVVGSEAANDFEASGPGFRAQGINPDGGGYDYGPGGMAIRRTT